ncbi:SpoIIE family protein phosphatase [Hespellia stercorisuis]
METGQVLHTSPYAIQIEKFANSLRQLSRMFLRLEEPKRSFSGEEVEDMFLEVKERVCTHCEKCAWCWGEQQVGTWQMGYEVLAAIDTYGNELNVEMKRKLQNRCVRATQFLKETLDVFHDAKKNMLWLNKMAWSREGCALQLDTFADMIQAESRELEDSIISDERSAKRIETSLKKLGARVLYTTFLITEEGKYMVYLTARAMRDSCVSCREILRVVSEVTDRDLVWQNEVGQVLGREYVTLVAIDGPEYYILPGIAKIGKGCSEISGDSFMMTHLPGGKQAVAISDGMGAGESARRESTVVMDLLEEFLEAGFPVKSAIQMINTALVMGREEIHFATIDMTVFDLYTGVCRLIKAGASSTFIKRGNSVEHLSSTSLPVGVLQKLEVDMLERQMESGDFLIMVTDGVLDALPVGEQDLILETIISGTSKSNAREMAHHILEQVLGWNGEAPLDDMTVLVVGLWKC